MSFIVTLIPFWSIVQGLFVNEGLHGRGSITPEWDVAHRAGVIVTVAGLVLRSGGCGQFLNICCYFQNSFIYLCQIWFQQ